MSEGWVMLHRELLDSKLWSCSDSTLRVAVYLILSANHKERFHRRITIKRGQCVRSITMISDACGLTRKTVRTALKNLTDDGFIVIDEPFGAQQGHRLTICKYGTYQGDDKGTGTPRAHAVSNELPLELPTNKNDKNENNRGGLTAGQKKRAKIEANTPTMVRIGKWFNRMESTLWTVYEAEALAEMGDISGDLQQMEAYYGSGSDILRRDIGTLLNNWNGEMDRARAYVPPTVEKQVDVGGNRDKYGNPIARY